MKLQLCNNPVKTIQLLQMKLETMNELSTSNGFYNYYFNALPKETSKEKAFKYVNNLYLQLFGIKRFSSFNEFKYRISTNKNI